MKRKIFEIRLRYRPIPLAPVTERICLYERALAFKTQKELGDYHTKNCPSCAIYRKWLCPVCNGYHFLAKEMPGSGGSSGNQRENTMHLPRAEWEGRIKPELPDTTLYVLRFTVEDQQKFPYPLAEIVRRLREDGAPVELDTEQLTYNRRHGGTGDSGRFALCNLHQRRDENGDILYGWHITTNTKSK